MGIAGALPPWDVGVADLLETHPSPRVIVPNLVALGQTIWSKTFWVYRALPHGIGNVADPVTPPPLTTCPSQLCSMLNLVTVGQTVWA